MNADIANHIKLIYMLSFHQTQPKEKIFHHNIHGNPWELKGVDMFTLNKKPIFAL